MDLVVPAWCDRTVYDDRHADLGHRSVECCERRREAGTQVSLHLSRYEPLTAAHGWRWALSHVARRHGQRPRANTVSFFERDVEYLLGALADIDDIPDAGWRWESEGSLDLTPTMRSPRMMQVAPAYAAGSRVGVTVQGYFGLLPPPGGVTLHPSTWREVYHLIDWGTGGDFADPTFVRPTPSVPNFADALLLPR